MSDNTADGTSGSGGGILNNLGTLSVNDGSVSGNSAARAGGGIEANVGTTIVDATTMSTNTTGPNPGNGGGLHLTGAGSVTLTGITALNNTAAAEGGAIWNSATGTTVVRNSSVTGNTASGAAADQGGGGLFNDGGLLQVSRSQVMDNVADGAPAPAAAS